MKTTSYIEKQEDNRILIHVIGSRNQAMNLDFQTAKECEDKFAFFVNTATNENKSIKFWEQFVIQIADFDAIESYNISIKPKKEKKPKAKAAKR